MVINFIRCFLIGINKIAWHVKPTPSGFPQQWILNFIKFYDTILKYNCEFFNLNIRYNLLTLLYVYYAKVYK